MIRISLDKKQKRSLVRYFKSTDRRVTGFLRGMSTHAARMAAGEINEKISPGADPLAKEYRDGVRALRVEDAAIIPQEEKGKKKKYTRIQEEHWAAVAVRADVKTFGQLEADSDRIIIKIRPLKRKMKKAPKYIWPLVRYGPWTLDTIPYIPKPDEALIMYVKVSRSEVISVKAKNYKQRSKVRAELANVGIAPSPSKNVAKDREAVEELEYYALRREFGQIRGKHPVWRPTIQSLSRKGIEYLLKTNSQLYRSLFDPSYGGYGRLGRFSTIDSENVKAFQSFQDKIR